MWRLGFQCYSFGFVLQIWGMEIILERPWRREIMHNLVKEATNFISVETILMSSKKLLIMHSSVGHMLNEVFEMMVEPTLLQPTFVLDYPVEITPLAKPRKRYCYYNLFLLFRCSYVMYIISTNKNATKRRIFCIKPNLPMNRF